jgi:putative Holliday junction resolvase
MDRLAELIGEEACAGLVVGDPKQLDGGASENSALVHRIIGRLKEQFKTPVFLQDERFTSKMAVQAMIEAGVPKQKRRQKERVDSMSAAIILQSFLDKKKSS